MPRLSREERREQRRHRWREHTLKDAMRRVLDIPEGRYVLQHIMDELGLMAPIPTGSTLAMNIQIGRREAALWIRDLVETHKPRAALLLATEYAEEPTFPDGPDEGEDDEED